MTVCYCQQLQQKLRQFICVCKDTAMPPEDYKGAERRWLNVWLENITQVREALEKAHFIAFQGLRWMSSVGVHSEGHITPAAANPTALYLPPP